MVDRHLVDDGHVEFVENQGFGEMPGKLRMSFDDRNRAGPPSLVGRLEFRRDSQTECEDVLQRKGRTVIVVDFDDEVGIDFREQLLRALETFEESLPVVLSGFAEVDCGPDGRHVRARDTRHDSRHQEFSFASTAACSILLRLCSIDRPPDSIMFRYLSFVMPVIEAAMSSNDNPQVAPSFDT